MSCKICEQKYNYLLRLKYKQLDHLNWLLENQIKDGKPTSDIQNLIDKKIRGL